GVPLVATNEPFFPTINEYEAHDALLAIAGGTVLAQTERRKLTDQHYFKSRAEMMELFADLPEALENSVEIAKRVSYRPHTRNPILPTFAASPRLYAAEADLAEDEELNRQARAGLAERLDMHGMAPGLTRKDYEDRLEVELKIIRDM